jgi:peptide subunit release factor 1 (eRF1)
MITEETLRELIKLSDKEAPMVSLYLNVDPSRHAKEEYRLTLRNLFKDVSDTISKDDVTRIENYLDFEYEWQGKSLAIFSSADRGVWRVYPLAVPVKDQIYVLNRPYIEPLSRILDISDQYAVALVVREGARLFMFRGGQLDNTAGTFGPVPERHKQGGWAASRLQRHSDEVALRNLREGAELLGKFCERAKCNRILLAGTDDNIHLFKDLLPKIWQDRIIGTFHADITAAESDILDRSLAVMQGLEPEREQRLVEEMFTAAAKGALGAIGLADTMAAVQDGRARVLIVADGYHAEGYQCTQCHSTTVEPLDTCPFCGGTVEHVLDAVNGVIHNAMEKGIAVEVVHDNEDLEQAGSIGAILRY